MEPPNTITAREQPEIKCIFIFIDATFLTPKSEDFGYSAMSLGSS
jgi:hypothetical protein